MARARLRARRRRRIAKQADLAVQPEFQWMEECFLLLKITLRRLTVLIKNILNNQFQIGNKMPDSRRDEKKIL